MSAVRRDQPPAPGAIRPLAFPRIQRRRLDNGLAVLAARHGDLPLVTAALVVDAGAAGDPARKAGLAQLTTDALEAGTRTRSAEQVAWELEHLGVELGSAATWDAAVLRITVPRERLEPALELFADIVRHPSFPADEVERLRDEQLANILQRRKEPRALANDMAAHFIFAPDVPYARPLVGTTASVEAIDRDDIEAFYRTHYLPNAASLLLVGDIDADDARALADHHFGEWPAGQPVTPEFEVVPGVETRTVFVVDRPGAVQSEIRIGDVGVARHHEDYFPLLVMNTILGGAFTSRLNLSLRERHGFTYGARSGFAFRRRPGPFIVQAAVATDVTARAVEEALREMSALRDEGASEQEVASARDYLRGILPLELQTTEQLASRLADLVIFELPDDYFQQYREHIAAVSPDDVHRVAREHLRLDRLAIVVVGDADRIAPDLESLALGPVVVHSDY
ncbi:MAG TPA: pitrilysin family protein [Longimicrobiales bacterium]